MISTLRAPSTAACCLYQKPTRKYEHKPISSQAKYIISRLAEHTRITKPPMNTSINT